MSLTTLLRYQFSTDFKDHDVSNPLVGRFIRTKRLAALKSRKTQTSNVASDEKQLTWNDFLIGVPRYSDTKVPRGIYDELVNLVNGVTGNVPSEELYSTVWTVYSMLSAVNSLGLIHTSRDGPKQQLEAMFGLLNRKTFDQINSAVIRLCEWKSQFSQTSDFKQVPVVAEDPTEFGSRFLFRDIIPAREEKFLEKYDVAQFSSDDDVSIDDRVFITIPERTHSRQLNQLPVQRSQPEDKSSELYDWNWLIRQCESYASFNAAGEVLVSEVTLAQNAHTLLCSKRSDDDIQTDLLDLFGFESINTLLPNLLKHRAKLKNARPSAVAPKSAAPKAASATRIVNTPGAGVSVSSKDQQEADRKSARQIRRLREKSVLAPDQFNKLKIDEKKLDEQANMFKDWKRGGDGEVRRSGLPEGAVRTVVEGVYEQVMIPPEIPDPLDVANRLPVSHFSEMAQLAFQGTATMNHLQSKCFNVAYKSNINMLVCAPTGAGKTNVAMMAILHEIEQHVVDGVLQREMFKIVYVAPMKALAAEVVAKFSQRLKPLNIQVRELTGDMQLTKAQIKETQIIVTTPEKWQVFLLPLLCMHNTLSMTTVNSSNLVIKHVSSFSLVF
jgi:hypothetical protein